MNKLWLGFALVVAYGSLYPFDFQFRVLNGPALQSFLDTCCRRPSRGDILGNVLLFAPFGFFGMLAAPARGSMVLRLFVVCLLGVAYAFALQVAQLYLPSRDENLQDVVWNTVGMLGGAVLGVAAAKFVSLAAEHRRAFYLVPWILIGAWLSYRLIPFVPSIDFQEIKDSLKPLLLKPHLAPMAIGRSAVSWMIVAYLLRHGQRNLKLDLFLPVLMALTFAAETLIVANRVHASDVAGAGLALVVWWGLLRHIRWQAGILTVLLVLMIVVIGLEPFRLRHEPAAFAWHPFHGFLGGSMYVNAQAACQKVFLYGSLIYLLWQMGSSRVAGTLFAFLVVAGIEAAQTRFTGHTPEATDPMLLILAALTMMALDSRQGAAQGSPRSAMGEASRATEARP